MVNGVNEMRMGRGASQLELTAKALVEDGSGMLGAGGLRGHGESARETSGRIHATISQKWGKSSLGRAAGRRLSIEESQGC
jgi:hypothetical protein